MEDQIKLTAYNVKTKEKGVEIQDAVIKRTSKGAYMAQGHDGKGNTLTALVNTAKAKAAVEAGIAKWHESLTEDGSPASEPKPSEQEPPADAVESKD